MLPKWGYIEHLIRKELDPWTYEHCQRVGRYARRFAEYLKLPHPTPIWLEQAGQLHDWGKLTSASEELQYRSSISHEEWDRMILHPEHGAVRVAALFGYSLIQLESMVTFRPFAELPSNLQHIWFIVSMIRSHHCRLGGHGYPSVICEDYPHDGKTQHCMWLADEFDLLTNGPYVSARIVPTKALGELEAQAHKGLLNMDLTRQFRRAWEESAL